MIVPACRCTAHAIDSKHAYLRLEYQHEQSKIVTVSKHIYIPVLKNKPHKLAKRIILLSGCDEKLSNILLNELFSCETINAVCLLVVKTFQFSKCKNRAEHYLNYVKDDENPKILQITAGLLYVLSDYRKEYGYRNDDLWKYLKNIEQTLFNPLNERTINWVKCNPMRLTIAAAAAKGRALQAGMLGMIANEKKQEIFVDESSIRNQIFLFPEVCVFKQLGPCSLEDEEKVEHLFNLSMENGVVPGYFISQLGSYRFGSRLLKDEIYKRSFEAVKANLALRKGLTIKLNYEDRKCWEALQYQFSNTKHEVDLHQFFKATSYMLGEGDEEIHCDFNTIKEKYLKNQIHPQVPFRFIDTPSRIPFLQFLDENKEFTKVLHEMSQQDCERAILFIPDIPPELEKTYHYYESLNWCYSTNGLWKKASFKQIQELWLTHEITSKTKVVHQHTEAPFEIGSRESSSLRMLLDIGWKLYTPEARILHNDKLLLMRNITTKPFISNMTTLDKLNLSEELTHKILERLDDHSELALMLTAEFQLLDLHQSNIGIQMVSPLQHIFHYKQFSVGDTYEMEFSKLLELHLKGEINSETRIGVKNREEMFYDTAPLKKHPHLEECLNSRWRLVFFDTDLSIGEDSYIHRYTLDKGTEKAMEGHLIPYRCDLFTSPWKDKPLSREAIAQWKDLDRIGRVRDWIENHETAIRKRIPKKFQAGMNKKLDQWFKDPIYSFSYMRKNNKEVTFQQLRNHFASDFCDLEQNEQFWLTFKILFEELHEPYYANIAENSLEGMEKRIMIAFQLFPKMTWYQKTALYERQNRCMEYLELYENMLLPYLTRQNKIDAIKAVLESPATPFTHFLREELYREYEGLSEMNDSQVASIFKNVTYHMIPTFFNICKSMYPLLGDAYELILSEYNSHYRAGCTIGNFKKPLESFIEKIKQERNEHGEDVYANALYLEKQIAEAEMRFGAWFGNFLSQEKK